MTSVMISAPVSATTSATSTELATTESAPASSERTFSIGDAAKLLNVPTSTLRFYEKEQLLPHVARTASGLRRYSINDLTFLRLVECLKATGMPLKEIRGFVDMVDRGDDSIDDRLAFFQRQKQRLEEQKAALEAQMSAVDFKVWYYQCAQKAGTTKVPERLVAQGEKLRPEILRFDNIDKARKEAAR